MAAVRRRRSVSAMPARTPAVEVPPLPRCAWCGERIGVFEPLIYETGAQRRAVRSAVLRLPEELRGGGGHATFFHVACHEAAQGC
jgi:hypothetical protein